MEMARIAAGQVVNLEVWPDGTPEIEGVLVAYDSTTENPIIGLSYDASKRGAERWQQLLHMQSMTDEQHAEMEQFMEELDRRLAARHVAVEQANARAQRS